MSKDEISVPRELLERATKDYTGRPMWDALENDRLASVEELRALLAQPNTYTKDGGQSGLGGHCEPCHSVEPVGLYDLGDGKGLVPLYRHPPAQTPVVMPERRKIRQIGPLREWDDGFNTAIDEFKRLNPGVTEAAPPRKS